MKDEWDMMFFVGWLAISMIIGLIWIGGRSFYGINRVAIDSVQGPK